MRSHTLAVLGLLLAGVVVLGLCDESHAARLDEDDTTAAAEAPGRTTRSSSIFVTWKSSPSST